jgi:Xaa-Pro aminopeptidase
LVHCNSYVDGLWTDITRTFSIGAPRGRAEAMYRAVLDAAAAAIDAVRPGVQASAVDKAAREVLTKAGFGREFKHATGRGVGFAAIDHNVHSRIHPQSDTKSSSPGWSLTSSRRSKSKGNAECGIARWLR